MLTIIFSKDGIPVSDFDLEKIVNGIKNLSESCKKESKDSDLAFSSENIFYMIRFWILKGKIDRDLIQFSFNGETSKINSYGVLENKVLETKWPSIQIDISEKILRNAFEMKKMLDQLDKNLSLN